MCDDIRVSGLQTNPHNKEQAVMPIRSVGLRNGLHTTGYQVAFRKVIYCLSYKAEFGLI